jgi:NhaA family Na+:H+ antiporter
VPGSLVGVVFVDLAPRSLMAEHPRPLPPDPVPSARLPRPIREFLETEAAGGIALLVAAVAAIVWVNSPFRHGYDALWNTRLSMSVGGHGIDEDLRHWVNDGLMAIFFFVVGLEIKRELVTGELRTWRRAATPAIAAVGGMVVPALIYAVVNAGGAGAHGWGIPMATDIAFALGVAALLGPRVPTGIKLFLLTLAIVDDIGAIVVIAVFYSSDVEPLALAAAAVLLGVMAVLRTCKVHWMPVYVVLGALVWLAVFESGVHATIAGVVLGLLAPARPLTPAHVAREWAQHLGDEPSPGEVRQMTRLARTTSSVTERLEIALHPVSGFVIVPIFALANAGVVFERAALRADGAGRVVAGVAFGLVVGKLVGVAAGAYLAVRLRIGALPPDVTWPLVVGAAALAGIGFTVSLFVTDLAFGDADLRAAAKIGILGASLVASALGAVLLLRASPRERR